MHSLKALPLILVLGLAACGEETMPPSPSGATPKDPATAQRAMIDRFSAQAGHLMVRSGNGLPAADAPIDFDQPPFITRGLGPQGQRVRYYNFDVQPAAPAPIYVLFRPGETAPVSGQLNVIDVIPGDAGYNDFWRVHKVTVPADYVANTLTSLAELTQVGFAIEPTTTIVNCPVVPAGSTAKLRMGGGGAGLQQGWYKGKVVSYFNFEERALSGTMVPLSPIYVTFNINPDQPNGGPPSGFRAEAGGDQTHNVIATLPESAGYSPLWSVNVLDNAAFDQVRDLSSATSATILARDVATVNCPVVEVEANEASVPVEAAALKAFLEAGTYRSFAAEAAPHPSRGPHGRVRTFVNQALRSSLARGAGEHPIGAASVKELFTGDQVTGWAVLVKVAASAGGQGFYWYETIQGNVVADGLGVGLCTGCHSGGGQDFVLTPATSF